MLQDHELFRQRIHAHWRDQLDAGWLSAAALLGLWARYKYVVLAHDQKTYRQIGPLLANLSGDVQSKAERVLKLMMAATALPASRRNHLNALQHVVGHVKKKLSNEEKQRWRQVLAEYEAGSISLQVPALLLQQYLHEHGSEYVRAQAYPGLFLNSQDCKD